MFIIKSTSLLARTPRSSDRFAVLAVNLTMDYPRGRNALPKQKYPGKICSIFYTLLIAAAALQLFAINAGKLIYSCYKNYDI